jgi:hypothetical protein
MAGRPGSQESAKADCQREHRHEVHAPGAHSTSPSACPRRQNWNIQVVADLAQTGPVPGRDQGRTLHLDPVRHLRRRWGKKLTVFTTGPVTKVDH